MDEDQLDDLKQFIVATVSRATANMATKDDLANFVTKGDLARIEKKVDNLALRVSDLDLKIDTISEVLHENLQDHETRITKLEQQVG